MVVVGIVGASPRAPGLNRNNPHGINHGRELLPWGLPDRQVLALAAHNQFPFYTEPFSNRFRYKIPSWFTTQTQQSSSITMCHSPRTFSLVLEPYRWTAPTSPQHLSPPPPLLQTILNPTLSRPTSLLNRDSQRYEGSVVQNSFTSPTGSHPWKPDGGMLPSHSGIIAGAIHKRQYTLPQLQ